VSVATLLISWQTYRLSVNTEANSTHLKAIEEELAENRFGFERMRDVYDRTEKYLSSENQNPSRGKVLVVLINSLPKSDLRSDLLSVVSVDAQSNVVAAQAADLKVGAQPPKPSPSPAAAFSGDRSVHFDPHEYEVTKNGDFSFTDSKGVIWPVRKGYTTSGASIPRSFWSIMGSPLSNDYVIAVILHDYHAELKQHSSDEVNQMFYEALLKTGVSEHNAKLLYTSVKQFGPRWDPKP